MYITLPSNVDAPSYNATNTRSHYITPLEQPLVLQSPYKIRVAEILYPLDWAYANGNAPGKDQRFFLSCDLFDGKRLANEGAYVGGSGCAVRHSAIFAWVPEEASSGYKTDSVLKGFNDWYWVDCSIPVTRVRVQIQDYKGRYITFKNGTVIVTLKIQNGVTKG